MYPDGALTLTPQLQHGQAVKLSEYLPACSWDRLYTYLQSTASAVTDQNWYPNQTIVFQQDPGRYNLAEGAGRLPGLPPLAVCGPRDLWRGGGVGGGQGEGQEGVARKVFWIWGRWKVCSCLWTKWIYSWSRQVNKRSLFNQQKCWPLYIGLFIYLYSFMHLFMRCQRSLCRQWSV